MRLIAAAPSNPQQECRRQHTHRRRLGDEPEVIEAQGGFGGAVGADEKLQGEGVYLVAQVFGDVDHPVHELAVGSIERDGGELIVAEEDAKLVVAADGRALEVEAELAGSLRNVEAVVGAVDDAVGDVVDGGVDGRGAEEEESVVAVGQHVTFTAAAVIRPAGDQIDVAVNHGQIKEGDSVSAATERGLKITVEDIVHPDGRVPLDLLELGLRLARGGDGGLIGVDHFVVVFNGKGDKVRGGAGSGPAEQIEGLEGVVLAIEKVECACGRAGDGLVACKRPADGAERVAAAVSVGRVHGCGGVGRLGAQHRAAVESIPDVGVIAGPVGCVVLASGRQLGVHQVVERTGNGPAAG